MIAFKTKMMGIVGVPEGHFAGNVPAAYYPRGAHDITI